MIRRILPYTSVLVVLAALYSGWTIYTRHQSAAEAERRSQEKQVDADREVVARFGGDQLRILTFSAEGAKVSPGGRALLCYGVSNAARVTIEPGVEPIKPALSHCLEVFPKRTTTYTLRAEDDKGNSKSASLTVKVR